MLAPGKERLVVVGNGMAGMRTVEQLLARAPSRYELTVFGAEPYPNYNRILLSSVLAGETALDQIVIHPRSWYARHRVRLIEGDPVIAIDRAAKTVVSAAGVVIQYDKLLLATGSKPLTPPIPGVHLPGVCAFRDIADVERMVEAARIGRRAKVIGGGLLGAQAARHGRHGGSFNAHLDGAAARYRRRRAASARSREAGDRVLYRRTDRGGPGRRAWPRGSALRRT